MIGKKITIAKGIDDGTSVMAEAEATLFGLKFCISNHLTLVVLETYLLAMKKILDGIWDPSWSIIMTVQGINRLRSTNNVSMSHVMRERN